MIPAIISLLILGAQTILLNGAGTGVRTPEYSNTLSGRIFDSRTGAPVPGIRVHVLRETWNEFGIHRFEASPSVVTNERGEYRISNVAPGDFFLAAGSSPYRTTYYPEAADPSTAVALNISAAEELRAIDLRVTPTRLATIRGRVIDALKVRQPHLSSVTLVPRYPRPEPFAGSTSRRVAPDGSFEITDVPAGSYYLTGIRIDDEPNRSRSVAMIEVNGEDIENFDLIAAEGHEVSGRVRIEGPEPEHPMTVLLIPARTPVMPFEQPPAVRPGGRFSLWNLPSGEYRLAVRGLPPEYHIKSARFGHIDALEHGISLHGAVSDRLEIVISNQGGRITGSVLDLQTSAVVLVPEISRPERSDLHKTAPVDADGRFTIDGVAPGRYRIVAAVEPDPNEYRDPAFVARSRESGRPVVIGVGDRLTIVLR